MLATRAADASVPVVYANLVGGQDELVFDGASLVFDEPGGSSRGPSSSRGPARRRSRRPPRVPQPHARSARSGRPRRRCPRSPVSEAQIGAPHELARIEPLLAPVHEVYEALVLGTRDYVRKNGFDRVLIGLSGGIDSALVAAIAVDALGPEHVTGVLMPSRYSSDHSITDAESARREPRHRDHDGPDRGRARGVHALLAPAFAGTDARARRGEPAGPHPRHVLMTISNKFGWMVLTTGNKSEMATGYGTLYGDMAGGFAVIKDVPKTLVYALCRGPQRSAPAASSSRETVLEKPPSAELRPDQQDEDSLPPYAVLDPVLEGYVEDDLSAAEIEAEGFDRAVVDRVVALVDRSEYKRRQAPPGVRVSAKAFGKDRRLPITNRWPG